jgi:PAS domain S-box-containing protein
MWVAPAGAPEVLRAAEALRARAHTEVLGAAALSARLAEGAPDVLVLAGEEALDLCRIARAARPLLALPVLVLGAPLGEALAAGASDAAGAGWGAEEVVLRTGALARARRLHAEAVAEARQEGREVEDRLEREALADTRPQALWKDQTRAEAELTALFASAPVGLGVIDRELRYVRVNPALASFNGATVEAHLGRTVSEMLPEHIPSLLQVCRRVLETGEPSLEQEAAVRADQRHFLSHYFPVRSSGEIVGVAAMVIDYTDRQRMTRGLQLLSRAGEVLMSSLDARLRISGVAGLVVPDLCEFCAIFLVDEGGAVRLVEASALDPGQVAFVRERMLSLVPGHGLEAVSRVIATGVPALFTTVGDAELAEIAIDPEHLGLLGKAGLRSWLCVPLRARGRTLGALSFGRFGRSRAFDAVDRELAEELALRVAMAIDNSQLFAQAAREAQRAEEANRLKDEFLANLSHELRTPLTAIVGWTRILRTRALPDHKRARALESIERNAGALARLVEDLLDVSRIIAERLTLELAPVDMALIIETAVEAVRPLAEHRRLRLESAIDPTVAPLMGDADRLGQVVSNLLANAVKFTPAGGTISVRLSREGAFARITVTDTGQGIAADFLPFVFERFRQADGGITRVHGGLGLGLAIARHLVALHEGTIEAASPGEGLGATFTVRLPLGDPPITVGGGAPTSPELPNLRGVRVAVAGDDLDIRALATSALESCGATVEAVSVSEGAEAVLAGGVPDVLVVDLGDLGAFAPHPLLGDLRALSLSGSARISAVAIMDRSLAEDRARAARAGFQVQVGKPIDPSELIAAVASLSRRV